MSQDDKYTTPSKLIQPIVDLSRTDPLKREIYSNSSDEQKVKRSGVGGGSSYLEPVPIYDACPGDLIMGPSRRNCEIRMIGDRDGVSKASGTAGKGALGTGAVQIVAGAMGPYARERDDEGEPIKCGPGHKTNSAEIYLSQRSHADEYFDLCNGTVGNCQNASAAVIKADSCRMVARHGIKLVTGTDARDSQGDRVSTVQGIDLIAGNQDDDLQPLVKGDNLVDALSELAQQIEKLREILYSFVTYQSEFNNSVMTHTHNSPFNGIITAMGFTAMPNEMKSSIQILAQTVLSLESHSATLSLWQQNYLSPVQKTYINSGWNNTN